MKINLPFYTPKQIWEGYKIMQSVKHTPQFVKMAKQSRHKAYLSHSQIGYKPKPQKTFKTRAKEFFTRVKDVIKSFDADD